MCLRGAHKKSESISQYRKVVLSNSNLSYFLFRMPLRTLAVYLSIYSFLTAQDMPTILSTNVDKTQTGLVIKFQLSSYIERSDISSWIERDNWFILNVYNIIRPEEGFFSNIIQFKLMKYINLLFFFIFSVCSFSQIERVDPPNWWVGFKNNELQLMIKGENISKYSPSVQYSGIEIKNFHKSNNNLLLFSLFHQ